MQVKIDINSQGSEAGATVTGNLTGEQAPGSSQDAGLPNVNDNTLQGAPSQSDAGMVDIGGPPQWLTEAMKKDSSAAPGAEQEKGEDGGAAPSFE